MKNFRTYKLSIEFFHEIDGLRMPHFLKEQLERAASSITLNLAEGSGKRTSKDQRKFYFQAFGSYKECKAIIELTKHKNHKINAKLEILGSHLWNLIQFHNTQTKLQNINPKHQPSTGQHPTANNSLQPKDSKDSSSS